MGLRMGTPGLRESSLCDFSSLRVNRAVSSILFCAYPPGSDTRRITGRVWAMDGSESHGVQMNDWHEAEQQVERATSTTRPGAGTRPKPLCGWRSLSIRTSPNGSSTSGLTRRGRLEDAVEAFRSCFELSDEATRSRR